MSNAFLLIPLFATLLSLSTLRNVKGEDTRKPYIVHMIKSMKPPHFPLHEHWYASLVNGVSGSNSDPTHLLYTYDIILHGFSAKLTVAEASALETVDGCLAVIPSSVKHMCTTHSPQFLGLSNSNNGIWSRSNYGKDVIVGVVDTGIWPESESFRDQNLGPVPAKWKGQCQRGEMFNSSHCNRKIIGARYFLKGYEAHKGALNESIDYRSARDSYGHGTHVASTVAGSPVPGANVVGFANGTAEGIAPQARLAVYKVSWGGVKGGSDDSDTAAAIEQAVVDGVDILSISLGSPEKPFYEDATAIAAFMAIQKGIFVSVAAGNEGPFRSSLGNTAPWMTTVGASNIDRDFPAPLILGNHEMYKGSSFHTGVGIEKVPLVYVSGKQSSRRCHSGSLDPNMVKGKIVLCDQWLISQGISGKDTSPYEKESVVKKASGVGMIVANEKIIGANDNTFLSHLPASSVSFADGQKIRAYINKTSNPTASIKAQGVTVLGKATAPVVAAFSSRGPSIYFPDILKPDVIAPGVMILAAYSGGVAAYSLRSGTSMSCPHVSGVAALIRSVHPAWSPAAIKSALMTTSYVGDNRDELIRDAATLEAANPYVMGAGHVNPTAAVNPGLVYDLAAQDYINYLCALNYTENQIALLTNKLDSCPKLRAEGADLNYPSFSVAFKSGNSVEVKKRVVTNVGSASAVYQVSVQSPDSVKISVEPKTLKFSKQNEKAWFSVSFESNGSVGGRSAVQEFGEISWKCIAGGTQVVRSPVAIVWPSQSMATELRSQSYYVLCLLSTFFFTLRQ